MGVAIRGTGVLASKLPLLSEQVRLGSCFWYSWGLQLQRMGVENGVAISRPNANGVAWDEDTGACKLILCIE